MKWESIITHWSLGAALNLSCASIRSQCQADYLRHKHGSSNDPFVMTYKLWLPGHPGGLREDVWPPRLFTHSTEPCWLQLSSVGSKKLWTLFTSFLLDRKNTSIHNSVKPLNIATDQIFIISECSIPHWNRSLQYNTCAVASENHDDSCHSSPHFGSFWLHHPVLTTWGHSRNWCEHSTGKLSRSHASRAESPLTPGSFWSSHWLCKAWNYLPITTTCL